MASIVAVLGDWRWGVGGRTDRRTTGSFPDVSHAPCSQILAVLTHKTPLARSSSARKNNAEEVLFGRCGGVASVFFLLSTGRKPPERSPVVKRHACVAKIEEKQRVGIVLSHLSSLAVISDFVAEPPHPSRRVQQSARLLSPPRLRPTTAAPYYDVARDPRARRPGPAPEAPCHFLVRRRLRRLKVHGRLLPRARRGRCPAICAAANAAGGGTLRHLSTALRFEHGHFD